MTHTIADLKNRTLVESNTLKSLILSSTHETEPRIDDILLHGRDDILIHDFQMANSITLNSIVSNFIVDLKYAWERVGFSSSSSTDSYFQIVSSIDLASDDAKIILLVDGEDTSFKSQRLEFKSIPLALPDGIKSEQILKFLNLKNLWYGLVQDDSDVPHNSLELIESMNDSIANPNTYGGNPFGDVVSLPPSMRLWDCDDGNKKYSSFNGFILAKSQGVNGGVKISKIIENVFFKSPEFKKKDFDSSDVRCVIGESQYLVCLTIGFFGLIPVFSDGEFVRFDMYDIGKRIANIVDSSKYEFTYCDFTTIGDQITLFVELKSTEDGTCRYLHMNNDSFDSVYGFKEITNLVSDGMIVKPS